MKQKTLMVLSAIICTIVIIAVIGAYTLTAGKKEVKQEEIPENTESSIEIYRPMITAAPEPSPVPTGNTIYYYLQSNGDRLNLYEMNGENKKTVKSIEINLDMFPAEDRELLKTGIKAFTLEEGIEIIENFIS